MVTLQKMTPEEYQDFFQHLIDAYARNLARNFEIPLETALDRAKKETIEVLVQGVDTPGQRLYMVRQEDVPENVGNLWVSVKEDKKEAWISKIEIAEAHRGKGLGREVLLLLEAQLKAQGFKQIGLHVFGDNLVARHLYESLGYEPYSIQMRKKLE